MAPVRKLAGFIEMSRGEERSWTPQSQDTITFLRLWIMGIAGRRRPSDHRSLGVPVLAVVGRGTKAEIRGRVGPSVGAGQSVAEPAPRLKRNCKPMNMRRGWFHEFAA